MELMLFMFSIAIIWINWKIYVVSKVLLEVSDKILDESKIMNKLLGAGYEESSKK